MILDFMKLNFFNKNLNRNNGLFFQNIKYDFFYQKNKLKNFKIKKLFYFKFYYFLNFKSKFKLN